VTVQVGGLGYVECDCKAVVSVKPGLSMIGVREPKAFSVQGHMVDTREALTRVWIMSRTVDLKTLLIRR